MTALPLETFWLPLEMVALVALVSHDMFEIDNRESELQPLLNHRTTLVTPHAPPRAPWGEGVPLVRSIALARVCTCDWDDDTDSSDDETIGILSGATVANADGVRRTLAQFQPPIDSYTLCPELDGSRNSEAVD